MSPNQHGPDRLCTENGIVGDLHPRIPWPPSPMAATGHSNNTPSAQNRRQRCRKYSDVSSGPPPSIIAFDAIMTTVLPTHGNAPRRRGATEDTLKRIPTTHNISNVGVAPHTRDCTAQIPVVRFRHQGCPAYAGLYHRPLPATAGPPPYTRKRGTVPGKSGSRAGRGYTRNSRPIPESGPKDPFFIRTHPQPRGYADVGRVASVVAQAKPAKINHQHPHTQAAPCPTS